MSDKNKLIIYFNDADYRELVGDRTMYCFTLCYSGEFCEDVGIDEINGEHKAFLKEFLKFKSNNLPVLIFYRNGKKVDMKIGKYSSSDIIEWVNDLIKVDKTLIN